jgi:hypothetical protein
MSIIIHSVKQFYQPFTPLHLRQTSLNSFPSEVPQHFMHVLFSFLYIRWQTGIYIPVSRDF